MSSGCGPECQYYRAPERDDYRDPLDDSRHIRNVLGYHPPADTDVARKHAELRDDAIMFAEALIANCPPSPERTLAFRHIQQAMMFGNAAIAIHASGPVADDPTQVHQRGDE